MRKIALPQDDLVEVLVPNPNEVEAMQMLFGWLGKSGRKGYSRLYDSLELQVYVEFPENEVQLVKSMEMPDNPLGGSIVWLPRDTKIITVGSKTGQPSETDFLKGEFQSSMHHYEDDLMGEMGMGLKANISGHMICGISKLYLCPVKSINTCPPRSSIFDCPIVLSRNICNA